MIYALFFIVAGIIAIFALDFSMASMLVGGVLIAIGVFGVLALMFEDDVRDNNTAFLLGAGVISAILVGVLNSNFAPNNNYDNGDTYGSSNVSFKGTTKARQGDLIRYSDGDSYWWTGPKCADCGGYCSGYYHEGKTPGTCENCTHSGGSHHY